MSGLILIDVWCDIISVAKQRCLHLYTLCILYLWIFYQLLCVSHISFEWISDNNHSWIYHSSRFFLFSELAKQVCKMVWIDSHRFGPLSRWIIWSIFSGSKTDNIETRWEQCWMKWIFTYKQLKQKANFWRVILRKFTYSCVMWISGHSHESVFKPITSQMI